MPAAAAAAAAQRLTISYEGLEEAQVGAAQCASSNGCIGGNKEDYAPWCVDCLDRYFCLSAAARTGTSNQFGGEGREIKWRKGTCMGRGQGFWWLGQAWDSWFKRACNMTRVHGRDILILCAAMSNSRQYYAYSGKT